MIATLLFAAAVNVAAPSTAVDDFKSLCVATKGDVAAVTAAAAAQGAWESSPTGDAGMSAWVHTGEGVARSLVAGVQDAPDGKRQICVVKSLPVQPELSTSIASALGGVSMPVDAAANLYAYAPDEATYRAGDVTFVNVILEDDGTSLAAIRPLR